MEKLYRKITLPSGRVRYYETEIMDEGNPKEGIWIVRKTSGGKGYTWFTDFIDDIPKIKRLAALENHRDEMCKIIIRCIDKPKYTINDVVTEIINYLEDKVEVDL